MSDVTVVVSGKSGCGKTAVRLLLQEALTGKSIKWTLQDWDEAEGEIPGAEARERADFGRSGLGALRPEGRMEFKVNGLVRITEEHEKHQAEATL
jgi:ABC-type glutathione transport system ATPase component